jgi:hypothetical protein
VSEPNDIGCSAGITTGGSDVVGVEAVVDGAAGSVVVVVFVASEVVVAAGSSSDVHATATRAIANTRIARRFTTASRV